MNEKSTLSKRLSLIDPCIHYTGRAVADEHGATFQWPGSGFVLSVRGGTVKARLSAPDGTPEYIVWIAVYVNGERTQKFMLRAEGEDIVLAHDLPTDTVTTIRVVKLSEHRAATLHDLTVDGTVEAALFPKRRMVCIGDSVTCGFGVLSKSTDPFTTETEDITKTCGWLLADSFGAELQVVAASGFGLTMSNTRNTEHILPRLYPYTTHGGTEAWDYECYQPNLVIVNLGTNDEFVQVPTEVLQAGIRSFTATLRNAHPAATIVWIYGFMINGYVDTVRQAVEKLAQTDSNLYFLEAETATGESELGSANHPSAAANARLAKQLQPQIATIMNWK